MSTEIVHVGRPTKLTPEVQKKITTAVAAGNYQSTAALLAGISSQTFHNWVDRGRNGEEPFLSFFEELTRAEAYAEAERIKEIRDAGQKGDWKAHAWYLERKMNKKWGKVDKTEVSHSGEVIHNHEYHIEQRIEADPESAELLKRLYARTAGAAIPNTGQG